MIRKRLYIARLISKELAGMIKKSEALELQQWVAESMQNEEDYKAIREDVQARSWNIIQDNSLTESEWEKFFEANILPRHSTKPVFRSLLQRNIPLSWAASFALIVLAGLMIYFINTRPVENPTLLTRVEAPIGSRSHVILPDGTEVWLNAGSHIRYANDYSLADRHVDMQGEVYFNVVKHSTPFTVRTPEINIRVLGTEFNVKAYPDEDVIETTLVSGSLIIEKGEAAGPEFEEILLTPNQKAVFMRAERTFTLGDTRETPEDSLKPEPARSLAQVRVHLRHDVTPEVSWKDGIIIVDSEPLGTLVRKLERRYDVTFVFVDEGLKDYVFSGRLKEASLEQVLQAMKLTSPIDYSIIENKVMIRENPDTKHLFNRYFN